MYHSLLLTFAALAAFILNPLHAEENMTSMPKNPTLVIETTQGAFEVMLFTEKAPKACENFLRHAQNNYYNGTPFHRVIKGFMIQGGDPAGNGTGGQSIWGASFPDEFSPSLQFDRKGLLAMANRGPNTNGSQFFITTAPTAWLNQKHTIFGEVTSGYDVVQKIETSPTDRGDRPIQTPKIVKISVKQ